VRGFSAPCDAPRAALWPLWKWTMDGTGDGASSVGSGAPDDITAADLDFVDTADLLSGDEESEAGGTGFTDDVTRMKVALANEKVRGVVTYTRCPSCVFQSLTSGLMLSWGGQIAPELLAFQTELVDDLKQQIQRQQARLQRTRMRVFAAVYQVGLRWICLDRTFVTWCSHRWRLIA